MEVRNVNIVQTKNTMKCTGQNEIATFERGCELNSGTILKLQIAGLMKLRFHLEN